MNVLKSKETFEAGAFLGGFLKVWKQHMKLHEAKPTFFNVLALLTPILARKSGCNPLEIMKNIFIILVIIVIIFV